MCTINRNNIPRPSQVKIELVVEQYLACCIAPSSMSSGHCDVLYRLGSMAMPHNVNPPCFSGMSDWFWAPYTTLSLWAPGASCDVGDMCLCSWTIFLWPLLWLLTWCLPWTGNWLLVQLCDLNLRLSVEISEPVPNEQKIGPQTGTYLQGIIICMWCKYSRANMLAWVITVQDKAPGTPGSRKKLRVHHRAATDWSWMWSVKQGKLSRGWKLRINETTQSVGRSARG
jgi:hypothetical protein